MTQQKQIADVPIKWRGKEFTATHALSCPCATIDYGDDMHEFRILDKRGG